MTDEETRGSCAVSSYLVSCGQAEQEARPGATVQLRPGGGAACRVRIVHTIAGKEEPSLTTDWSPAFSPATAHLQLVPGAEEAGLGPGRRRVLGLAVYTLLSTCQH